MGLDKVQDWDETASNNTLTGSINIDEGWAPSDVNNAARERQAQLRKWNLSYGFISGLVPTNDTDTAHDISLSVGDAADSTNVQMIHLDTAMVKQIDANWAAGTAAGGFPSGLTLTADVWYHRFLIGKTDGTTDWGWDSSTSAANLLTDATGYTLYRRVGSDLVDGSADIIQSGAVEMAGGGLEVTWRAGRDDENNTSDLSSGASITLESIPLGIKVRAHIRANLTDSDSAVQGVLYSLEESTAPDPATTHGRTLVVNASNQVAAWQGYIRTNTSRQIGARLSNAVNTTLDIGTVGWIDERR